MFETTKEREQEQSYFVLVFFSDEYLRKKRKEGRGEETNKPLTSCKKIRKLQIVIFLWEKKEIHMETTKKEIR